MTVHHDQEERLVDANGVTFRCRVTGRVGAPWLAFSNSLMTDLSLWDEQVAALEARFRILRYDQRGHGGTAVPDDDCTFDGLVDDVVALFDHFGIDRAAFVGISMGGVTALRLAARHPGRVSHLAICDAQALTPPDGAANWQGRIELAQAGGMVALAGPTIGRWFTSASRDAAIPAIDKVRGMIRTTPLDGFVRCARALQSYDFHDDLRRLACPVLMLAGASDGRMPETMRAMAGAAGADFIEIAEAGHLPNIEQPRRFNDAVAALLRDR